MMIAIHLVYQMRLFMNMKENSRISYPYAEGVFKVEFSLIENLKMDLFLYL